MHRNSKNSVPSGDTMWLMFKMITIKLIINSPEEVKLF